jgi:hypothetical protein
MRWPKSWLMKETLAHETVVRNKDFKAVGWRSADFV